MNTQTHARPLPATIPEYLAQLRQALADADPALIQDALYDAEEYLRSEMAAQPGRSEAEVIAEVAGSYGEPGEVADIYRETEVTVTRALRPPLPPRRRSPLGRFFGVAADPRTYGALFYVLVAVATGTFYFSWVVTGAALSAGLLILIIGVPLLVLFLGSVRMLSLVEGRLVEVLLGVRMPRRPTYVGSDQGWRARIGAMFGDARTWSTMLYFLLMLPLGIVYSVVFSTLLSLALGLMLSPLGLLLDGAFQLQWGAWSLASDAPWALPLICLVGVVMLFATLHLARGVGRVHGLMAKHLLVRTG